MRPCSAYVTAVAAGGRRPPGTPELKVVHTALHGVGDATLRAALDAAGWPAPVPVAAQREPDPDFPTVPYPNPEAAGRARPGPRDRRAGRRRPGAGQ